MTRRRKRMFLIQGGRRFLLRILRPSRYRARRRRRSVYEVTPKSVQRAPSVFYRTGRGHIGVAGRNVVKRQGFRSKAGGRKRRRKIGRR